MIEISDFGLDNIQAPLLQAINVALELVYIIIHVIRSDWNRLYNIQ